MIHRWQAAAGAAVAVLALAACGTASPSAASGNTRSASGSSTPQAAVVTTKSTSIGTVLTDSKGFTLYYFSADKPGKSNCNGACAQLWPPLLGSASSLAGAHLPGKLGTITRTDGATQITYNGHPLYTYSADSAPGQTNGNGLNVSGGLWYAAKPSLGGTSSSSSGGGW